MKLGQRFSNPLAAKEVFQQLKEVEIALHSKDVPSSGYSPLVIEKVGTQSPSLVESGSSIEIVHSDPLRERIAALPASEQIDLLSDMFTSIGSLNYSLSIPNDFLKLSLDGMMNLEAAGRHNLIYGLAKGFATPRPDGSDSCFPTKRMPIGLLQYMIEFFISKPGHQVIFGNS